MRPVERDLFAPNFFAFRLRLPPRTPIDVTPRDCSLLEPASQLFPHPSESRSPLEVG